MAKCDICNVSVQGGDLILLRPIYQTQGIRDVCPKCLNVIEDELLALRLMVAPVLRERIRQRANKENIGKLKLAWEDYTKKHLPTFGA